MASCQDPSLFVTTSLAQSIYKLCGTAGMSQFSAIQDGDYLAVIGAAMPSPSDFNDAESFALAYQSYSLLRKYSSFPVDLDRRAVALLDFRTSEVTCGQINREVDALPYVPGIPLEYQSQSLLEYARSLIARALGKFDWNELHRSCSFSNGASTRCSRRKGHPYFKLEGKPHVTNNCHILAVTSIWHNDLWRRHFQDMFGRESDPFSWCTVVPGSRFETVPKDSDKDRPICIEPDLNMFFQKGIGKMLRAALRRVGVNLNSQTRNQLLALLGSLDNSLATIDLRGASDSVSLRICELLLPESWYQAILLTRSPYVEIDGKWVKLEKVSSMGNGFTFELESLIFWALAKAACLATSCYDVDRLSVYGDDIIVPTQASSHLIRVLKDLGFETNLKKTFVNGPFRESCGKHYFLGADVSPFKITEPIETWADSYHLANQLREWGWADQSQVDSIVSRILAPIPPRNRCYVPMSFGSKSGLRVPEPRKRPVWDPELGSFVHVFHYMAEETSEHDLTGPHAYVTSMLCTEQSLPSSEDNAYRVEGPRPETGRFSPTNGGFSSVTRKDEGNWVRRRATSSSWSVTLAA